MKKLIILFTFVCSIAYAVDTPLTQQDRDSLEISATFKAYIVNAIMGDDRGGTAYLIRLTTTYAGGRQQRRAANYAEYLSVNPNLVESDPNLVPQILQWMNDGDIDKKSDVGGNISTRTQNYLNSNSRIELLVETYFAIKAGNYRPDLD